MSEGPKLADDFKVHDAYVAFSAEVVRLALLGLTAIPFLVATVGKHVPLEKLMRTLEPGLFWLASGVGLLAMAIALGLSHRYVAIDYMSTHIEFLRGKIDKEPEWRLTAATFAIGGAAGALALGFCLVVLGVAVVLRSSPG
jgi:hypothetical protein